MKNLSDSRHEIDSGLTSKMYHRWLDILWRLEKINCSTRHSWWSSDGWGSGMSGYVSGSAVVKSVVIVNIPMHNTLLAPPLFSISIYIYCHSSEHYIPLPQRNIIRKILSSYHHQLWATQSILAFEVCRSVS